MFKTLRNLFKPSARPNTDSIAIFLDRNDFRLHAMQQRLEEHGIHVTCVKQTALYVHPDQVDEAKHIVATWVN
ncbi:hypothetical protein [Aneurinibacillus uraniidurans]|uniref:hypothetical protein n=1 Tax=Aneurinibacillus uraniidurans TaxID=2966586 RepID=UPI00234A5AA2|nr:hypothetical protein [Aneurinibacillus sp. B1]WCN39401.1 hypothetical protein PO771_08430 [Aneurinibacillus sp. B1]